MKLIYIIGQFFFIPHIILYMFSKNKEIISKDLYKREEIKKGIGLYSDLSKELLINKYFRTLFYFRVNNIFSKILRIIFPKHSSFTIDINTKLGGGVHLAHPYSTIINAESIGENLYINQIVTIGEKNGLKPIIGDNVEIHAHSIVIGGIIIGDNVIIGAGSVVVKDIPDNTVVAGNPAKIIKRID